MANAGESNGQHSVTVETMPAASFARLEPGTDPPSYEEAVNPFIAPPSYDSLFGRAIEARKSSKGVLDFFKSLLILVLGTSKFPFLLCPISKKVNFSIFPDGTAETSSQVFPHSILGWSAANWGGHHWFKTNYISDLISY